MIVPFSLFKACHRNGEIDIISWIFSFPSLVLSSPCSTDGIIFGETLSSSSVVWAPVPLCSDILVGRFLVDTSSRQDIYFKVGQKE